MAKTMKEPQLYYRERTTTNRRWRFCLLPINCVQTKEERRSDQVNLLVSNKYTNKNNNSVQLEKDDEKKILQHFDAVLRKLEKIHKSVLWNIYIGRAGLAKKQFNLSSQDERCIDYYDDLEFSHNKVNSWSDDSLSQIEGHLEASEISTDGVVSLFSLKSDQEVDMDEAAWTLQKALIQHCCQTEVHRIINKEGVVTRQNMEPQYRRVRTSGRSHAGFVVYLGYQLVDTITQSQVMGDTVLYTMDIKAKKKYLNHHIGDLRLAPPVEEKCRRKVEQIKEWLTRDQLELLNKLENVTNSDDIKIISQMIVLMEAGKQTTQSSSSPGGGGLGLPDFIAFLSTQQHRDSFSPFHHHGSPLPTNGQPVRRSSSRQSISSMASTPASTPRYSGKARRSTVSSAYSSCSSTPETARRVSTSSQESSGGSVGLGRSNGVAGREKAPSGHLRRKASHLADIQSDSDSLDSTSETLVDKSETNGLTVRTRRDTLPGRKPRQMGGGVRRANSVRDYGSAGRSQLNVSATPEKSSTPRLTRTASDRRLSSVRPQISASKTMNSSGESKATHDVIPNQLPTTAITDHSVADQEKTNNQTPEERMQTDKEEDARLVAASVKLSRQVKRHNSVNSPVSGKFGANSPRMTGRTASVTDRPQTPKRIM